MIDPQTFGIFLTGALLLNLTPGPDMAFTLATSARSGVRAGMAAALGVGVGCIGWAVLTAAGLAALLAASEYAFTLIRFFGGVYLIFLAVRTFLHRHEAPHVKGGDNIVRAFRAGLLTNLFNPKVGLFFLAFLPSFTNPAVGPVWGQTFILGVIFSVTGACVLAAIAVAAGSARSRLAQSQQFRSRMNVAAASIFAGLGLYLLFSRAD